MLTKEKLEQLQKDNPFSILWEIIYEDIYSDISSGILMPGDRVSDLKIANSLGTSRSPVKKAIDKLIAEGILYRTDKKIYVTELTIEDYFSLYEARVVLEKNAAYMAAKQISSEQLVYLEKILKCIKEAATTGNVILYRKNEQAFHKAIILATNNKYFMHMYATIQNDLSRYQFALTKKAAFENRSPDYLLKEYQKHYRIFFAIKNGLALEAQDAMETDLKTMYQTICHMNQSLI